MIITNNTSLLLNTGTKVKVIQAENGAKGAEGAIGIYIGIQKHLKLKENIRGKASSCPNGYIVMAEDGDYWNIGTDIKLEIIFDDKNIKENEMIIKDFEFSRSGNGIKVNFADGTFKKTYSMEEPDKFDIKKALYICLAKKYSNEYKCDDIEELAKFFSMKKKYIKEVERVFAEYEKEEEAKRIIASRRAKKIRYKANKKAREREEMIEIQKEAYLRAMREANK